MQENLSREEILERSQRENRNGDEREKAIQIQGESFSLIFIFLLGGVLIWWKRAHGLPAADIQAMFWMSCAASRIYRLAQRRNLSDIITLVLCLAGVESGTILFTGVRAVGKLETGLLLGCFWSGALWAWRIWGYVEWIGTKC